VEWQGEVKGEKAGGPVDCLEAEDVPGYHPHICWLEGVWGRGGSKVGYVVVVRDFSVRRAR